MRTFTELRGRVVRLGVDPDGATLTAAVRGREQLGMWAWPGGAFSRMHPYIDGPVSSFAYSPDGKWFVIGGEVGLTLPYIRAEDKYDSEMHARKPADALAFSSRVVTGRTVLAIGCGCTTSTPRTTTKPRCGTRSFRPPRAGSGASPSTQPRPCSSGRTPIAGRY